MIIYKYIFFVRILSSVTSGRSKANNVWFSRAWLVVFSADLLTVNETSVEPPQDDGNSLNSPRNLALEATFINHNFSQQVLKTVSSMAPGPITGKLPC
jgi:hypothetical protein